MSQQSHQHTPRPGRPVTSERPHHIRRRRRWHALRALGVPSKEIHGSIQSCQAFVAKVLEYGGNPADYGDLAEKLPSGHARKQGPEYDLRRERYAKLRAAGWSTVDAMAGARSESCWVAAERRMNLGLKHWSRGRE